MASARGLSCYTANLLAYLERLDGDAVGRMARSVRTAVRTDLADRLTFSHHREPLDRLPGGDRLVYRGAPDGRAATTAIAAELSRHGQVLVVVDSAALPWSPGRSRAPHWLLADDRRGERWHVVDRFEGLLPDGPQEPFDGWLTTGELTGMTRPAAWSPEQLDRNALAFGHPTALPRAGTCQWLERRPPPHPEPQLSGDWLRDDVAALDHLASWFTSRLPQAVRHLDDVWAAARHQVFRLDWLASRTRPAAALQALRQAAEAWEALPQALRFAVGSAQRGRPRPGLVRETLDRLADLQARLPDPAGTATGTPAGPPERSTA